MGHSGNNSHGILTFVGSTTNTIFAAIKVRSVQSLLDKCGYTSFHLIPIFTVEAISITPTVHKDASNRGIITATASMESRNIFYVVLIIPHEGHNSSKAHTDTIFIFTPTKDKIRWKEHNPTAIMCTIHNDHIDAHHFFATSKEHNYNSVHAIVTFTINKEHSYNIAHAIVTFTTSQEHASNNSLNFLTDNIKGYTINTFTHIEYISIKDSTVTFCAHAESPQGAVFDQTPANSSAVWKKDISTNAQPPILEKF
ncbi:hypothetical protein BGX31_000992 [Mortierella sp. GBA43]|nr:hypothetical protein BGX31_000992 [Mortierella sp. GBA43]